MNLRKLFSREVGLLLKSKSSQDHQWLIKHLSFGKPFTPNNVEFSNQERAMYINNIEYIITAANREWGLNDNNPYEELEDETEVCQICGNTKTKKIFFIKNRLTNEELNVGSECIKKFGIAKSGTMEQAIREFEEDRKRTRVIKFIPDIYVKAVLWKNEVKIQPYIIPNKFAMPFLKICGEIESEYNIYIQGKDKPSSDLIERFKFLIDKGEECLTNIKKYIEEISLVRRPAERRIWTWMKREQMNEGLRMAVKNVEETGQILWKDAWRIKENSFMRSLIDNINDFLQKNQINIKFIDVDAGSDRNGRYVIETSAIDGNLIKFSCPHEELFLEFGDVLLGNENDNENNLREIIIKTSIPYSSKDMSHIIAIARNNFIGKMKLFPEYDNDDTNMVAVFNRDKELFAWIGENTLARILVPFSVGLQDEVSIVSRIEKLNLKWITKKEIKERLSIGKIMKNKY